MRYKEALGTASCPSCGGPAALGEMSFDEHHLRLENARLRDEIDRISGIAAKHVGKPMVSFPVLSSPLAAAAAAARSPLDLAGAYGVQSAAAGLGADHLFGAGAGDLLRSVSAGQLDADKPMIVELAVAAMDELLRMARPDALLWGGGASAGAQQQLDEEEYVRTFPAGLGPRQYGLRPEASRDSAVVIMTCDSLIEILMDAVSDGLIDGRVSLIDLCCLPMIDPCDDSSIINHLRCLLAEPIRGSVLEHRVEGFHARGAVNWCGRELQWCITSGVYLPFLLSVEGL
jgi:homeobox-leucine zipper protein